jgi:hypothetical protein
MQKATTRCVIKILVNPNAQRGFSLSYKLGKTTKANVKVILNNPSEIHPMLDNMEETLDRQYNYDVEFNWKNTPGVLQSDARVRERLLRIFQSGLAPSTDNSLTVPTVPQIEKLVQRAILHVQNYGNAPNFQDDITEKGRQKIRNYLASHLGMPNLTMEMAMAIAERMPTNSALST